jgi:CBS domain-containing protein
MTTKATRPPTSRVVLGAATAADMMTPNPASIREEATVQEAIRFLTAKGFRAAAVIDPVGRPIGVVSTSDIVVHQRAAASDRPDQQHGTGAEDTTRVRDIMTPAVFSVTPETAAAGVAEAMVALKVHRLFVVDQGGILVGVISALDVLRHLRPEDVTAYGPG